MDKIKPGPKDTRKIFWQKGACSTALFYLLNREFGTSNTDKEFASAPLAGGLLLEGYQCGMLWGASLAIGTESYRRYKNKSQAREVAILATQLMMESFTKRTNTIHCRDIAHCNFKKKWEFIRLMIKLILQGFVYSHCFNLMVKWVPEAIAAAHQGLSQNPTNNSHESINCASLVAEKMDASEEERVTVAGFAGGLGLSGSGCGALSTVIWLKTLDWCKQHPGKIPPFAKNPITDEIAQTFISATDSEFLCSKISGQCFKTVDNHTEFMKQGGCKSLIRDLVVSR